MKKYIGILLMTSCFFVIACSSDKKPDAVDTTATKSDAFALESKVKEKQKPITQLPKEMPEGFASLDIPLFKGSEIQNVAQHNHTTSPKIQVRFKTESTPKEVEAFYITKMKQKGWKVTNSTKKPRENGAHFSVYNNGEKQFIVNSLQHPETKMTVATMILMNFSSPGTKATK